MIYADNAATTRLDADAFEVMRPFLLEEFGNASQPYAFARKPKKALQEARKSIASSIGASPDEIFFSHPAVPKAIIGQFTEWLL